MANAAEKQGMNTNLTHVLHQTPEGVFNFICKTLEAVHKQSVSLVCGMTQLMLVRTFHSDDAQRWPFEKTRDFLKAQLNERGLKRAQVYIYIATAQTLAQKLFKKHSFGGAIHQVLAAENEQKGFNAIMSAVMGHDYSLTDGKVKLEWLLDDAKKPRFSLDVLRVNLDLDKLDPTKQPGYVKPETATNPQTPTGQTPTLTPPAQATKAAPASVVARVKADPEIFKDNPEVIIAAADKVVGREKFAERLISLCTMEECLQLQTVLNARMQALAETPETPAEPEEQPAQEGEPETPVETEVTETAGRRRTRGNKPRGARNNKAA